MRRDVKIFVSYSHNNQKLSRKFIKKLKEYTRPSKKYNYHYWQDSKLHVGDEWDREIKKALEECDLGLLLISASFLGSKYITEIELQYLNNKPLVPVLLWPVDFERHDLKGLDELLIFRLTKPGLIRPKAYGECTVKQREAFVLSLFQQMETRFDKLFQP